METAEINEHTGMIKKRKTLLEMALEQNELELEFLRDLNNTKEKAT